MRAFPLSGSLREHEPFPRARIDKRVLFAVVVSGSRVRKAWRWCIKKSSGMYMYTHSRTYPERQCVADVYDGRGYRG